MISDSFHAALSSRVLWVAMVAIWILIGALLPISYREDYTSMFLDRDLGNGPRLKAMLAQGLVDSSKKDTPLGRIANNLPADLKSQLRQVGEGEDVRIWFSTLADSLNELFKDDSWYDPDLWQSTVRLRELRELDQQDAAVMSDSLRDRRTRLRIEAALPGVFQTRSARSIYLTYLGMDFPARLAIDKSQFLIVLNQMVVPTIINWLLGFILVFLGILVTASIVPDMLQPGSLHLLLSKPVSRSMLLISKFIGGCAFVFLCVVQLVVGLYLVAGLRLDVWNARLLLCIPVSVFVFAVFYSVSTLAGLRWRSPILAIAVTCMFGAYCVVVGVIGGFFDVFVTRPDSIDHLTVAGDELFATTRGQGLMQWDESGGRWDPIFESDAMGRDRVLPPLTLDDSTIVTARVRGGRFNAFGLGAFDLQVLSDQNNWRPEPSLRLPTATSRLIAAGENLIAMNTSSIAMTSKEKVIRAVLREQPLADTNSQTEAATQPDWLAKLSNMMGVASSEFQEILPASTILSPPRGVAVDDSGNQMVMLNGKELIRLQRVKDRPDAKWQVAATVALEGELPQFASMAVSGEIVLLTTNEDFLYVFELDSLAGIERVPLPDSVSVTAVVAIGQDSSFALFTSDARCRILTVSPDSKNSNLSQPLEQTKIQSIQYDSINHQLLIAHHVDQVDIIDGKNLTPLRKLQPKVSRWRQLDRYLIKPLRTLTPQTGELGGTVAAIISGESSLQIQRSESEPAEFIQYKILEPIVSCALFIVIMLTISCVYFSRSDF